MKDQVRQTQMVMSFGPGSMIDMPTQSVMVAGLEHWRYTLEEQAVALIQEPRLLKRLCERFGISDAAVSQACRRLALKAETDQQLKDTLGRLEKLVKDVI